MARLLGQFHTLVDRGARRDAVQMQQLKCAKTKRNPNLRIELGARPCEQLLNLIVQLDLPAQHTKYECCGEVTVGR
jgi:hypothetical protein